MKATKLRKFVTRATDLETRMQRHRGEARHSGYMSLPLYVNSDGRGRWWSLKEAHNQDKAMIKLLARDEDGVFDACIGEEEAKIGWGQLDDDMHRWRSFRLVVVG